MRHSYLYLVFSALMTTAVLAVYTVFVTRDEMESYQTKNQELTAQLKQVTEQSNIYQKQAENRAEQLQKAEKDIHDAKITITKLKGQVQTLENKFEKIFTVSATAYAPLDPLSSRGECYSGDPEVTASGEKVEPGVTVAAGPELPLGTRLLVEGHGEVVVQDRGGAVGGRDLDIAVSDRRTALRWGRRGLRVIILENDK